ncbi:MAG: ABC transporter substrate-binding protein, partial [Sulfurimonas sp.]|nr:ABC transporter substrate-binding protein [Sulfurimonas sp.]
MINVKLIKFFKRANILIFMLILLFTQSILKANNSNEINIAVEFVTHAASAHIAKSKGWYKEAGLNVKSFDSYVNGMALGAALSRGEVDAAYICLSPAINAYANARVPLKIVCGLHLYGYSLVVNPDKIKKVEDLNNPKFN